MMRRILFSIIFISLLYISLRFVFDGYELSQLLRVPERLLDFSSRTIPPDFSELGIIVHSILVTMAMAFIGTLLGTLISLPLSISATALFSPRWLAIPADLLMSVIRTIPSLVWALLAVAAFGLGNLSGVFALAIYSAGYLSKLYADGFESIDLAPFDSIRLTGASRLQSLQYALWPQIQALILSNTIFIFEYNIRTATILGVVGAGGVGYHLHMYIQQLDYPRVTALLLVLVPVVALISLLSHRLRQRLSIR